MKQIINNIDKGIQAGKDNAAIQKRINDKRELINAYVNDYLSEEQLDVLQFIIDIANKPFNKHEIVSFIQSVPGHLECTEPRKSELQQRELLNNYDTAYPINYMREIESIYPEACNGNYIFDYSNLSFGRLVNLNNLLVRAIIKKMK